jgi:hypothetical protein
MQRGPNRANVIHRRIGLVETGRSASDGRPKFFNVFFARPRARESGQARQGTLIYADAPTGPVQTEVKPSWDYDPDLRPKNFQQHAFGMVNALERAVMASGSYGKKAASGASCPAYLEYQPHWWPGSHEVN